MQLNKQINNAKFMMYDPAYLFAIVAMLGFGLIMVFSASMTYSGMKAQYGYDEFYFVKRQAVFVGMGLLMGSVVYQIPLRILEKHAIKLFMFSVALLVLLLFPMIGKTINHSTRWINLMFFSFQPSELIKLAMIIYLANFAVRKADVMHVFNQSFLPVLLVMMLIGVLLMQQPDLSTFIVIASIAICMMWLAGINLPIFIGMILTFFAGVYWYIGSAEYRLKRLATLINGPWADSDDTGYQVTLSLVAYGNGGLTGVGLGGAWSKMILPEAYNDFLISVIAEECGLIGVAAVILLICFVVIKGFKIGAQAQHFERPFAALLAYGISLWFAIQSIVHIGVSVSVLPATGVNLPLMSYGGSSMIVTAIAIAMMLRVDYENRCIQKGIHV